MENPNKVYLNRKFNCAASELFRWLIEPRLIVQWFGPKHLTVGNVETQPQIGGEFSIELQKPTGENFFLRGKYLDMHPPTLLVFSFHYSGLSPAPPDSVVKITLEQLSTTKSQLFFVQEFQTKPNDFESRTAAWQHMFDKLARQI